MMSGAVIEFRFDHFYTFSLASPPFHSNSSYQAPPRRLEVLGSRLVQPASVPLAALAAPIHILLPAGGPQAVAASVPAGPLCLFSLNGPACAAQA
jgi:hypothetical protein